MAIKYYYYHWHGIDHKGFKLYGIKSAVNRASLKTELGKQGIFVRRITKKGNFLFRPKITQANISTLCRQLATMLKAGIPLFQSFDILHKSQTNLELKFLLEDIRQDVGQGIPLSVALQKHSQYFNLLVCNLLFCGEQTGKLDTMLEKVVKYKEQIALLKQKLQKALTYPLIVLLIAFLVISILLVVVIPQFELLFRSLGSELPPLTTLVIGLSTCFKNYGLISITLCLSLIYGLFRARQSYPLLRAASDRLIINLPVIGSPIRSATLSLLAQTMALCFSAGLPITETLEITKGVTKNQCYLQAIEQIIKEIISGQQLHVAMTNTNQFPAIVLQMVAIGEESGTLELMLAKIAEFNDEEANKSMDALMILLEPIIMTILGLIIGTLVIAMYLPVFKLGSVV